MKLCVRFFTTGCFSDFMLYAYVCTVCTCVGGTCVHFLYVCFVAHVCIVCTCVSCTLMRLVYSIILANFDLGYASTCTLRFEAEIPLNPQDCASITTLSYTRANYVIPDKLPYIPLTIAAAAHELTDDATQQIVDCKVDDDNFGTLKTAKINIGYSVVDGGTRVYRPDEAGVICRRIWDFKILSVLKKLNEDVETKISDEKLGEIRYAFPRTVTLLEVDVNACSPGTNLGEWKLVQVLLPALEAKLHDEHAEDLDEKVVEAINNWDDDPGTLEKIMSPIFKPDFDIEVAWDQWMSAMGDVKYPSDESATLIKKNSPKTLEALFDHQWNACFSPFRVGTGNTTVCKFHQTLLPALAQYVQEFYSSEEFDAAMATVVKEWTGAPEQMEKMHVLLIRKIDIARNHWYSVVVNIIDPDDIKDLELFFSKTLQALYAVQWKMCGQSFAQKYINPDDEDICDLHKIVIPVLTDCFERGSSDSAGNRLKNIPELKEMDENLFGILSQIFENPSHRKRFTRDTLVGVLKRGWDPAKLVSDSTDEDKVHTFDKQSFSNVLIGTYINLYTTTKNPNQLTIVRQFTKLSGKRAVELSIVSSIIGDLVDYAKEDSKKWKKFNEFYENMFQLGIFKQCGFLCDIEFENVFVEFYNTFNIEATESSTTRKTYKSSRPKFTVAWTPADTMHDSATVQAHAYTILFAAKEFVAIENKERKMFTEEIIHFSNGKFDEFRNRREIVRYISSS